MSLGGVETYLQVPQLSLMFDVGYCPRSLAATPRLLITHAHGDHSGGLIGMLSLRLLHGMKEPLEVYAPAPMCEGLRTAVDAYGALQGTPYRWTLKPVTPGMEFSLNRQYSVRTFESVHVTHTIGYSVWETVRKLKAEFVDLPGQEIARRKKEGEDLFNHIERPVLSFPGDTTVETLDQQPHLYESRILLLEATYLDDRRSPEQCRQHGHVHLDEVLERAERFQNQHLVLTHFSQSYQPDEIREILTRRCQGRFVPEVQPLLPNTPGWPG
jgi:ribonuclease Z